MPSFRNNDKPSVFGWMSPLISKKSMICFPSSGSYISLPLWRQKPPSKQYREAWFLVETWNCITQEGGTSYYLSPTSPHQHPQHLGFRLPMRQPNPTGIHEPHMNHIIIPPTYKEILQRRHWYHPTPLQPPICSIIHSAPPLKQSIHPNIRLLPCQLH